jgi:hypothetical protein
MDRSRRLKLQASAVALLGAIGLVSAPERAEARAPLDCYAYCSDALFYTNRPPGKFAQCSADDWDCPQEAPFIGTCGYDS